MAFSCPLLLMVSGYIQRPFSNTVQGVASHYTISSKGLLKLWFAKKAEIEM
jgi:hypothetical protein